MKIWSKSLYKLRSHEISSAYAYNMRERLEVGKKRDRNEKEHSLGRAGMWDAIRASKFAGLPPISYDRYGRRRRLIAPRAIARVGMAAGRMICAFDASDVRKQRYATRAAACSFFPLAKRVAGASERIPLAITPSGNESW